MIRTFLLVLLLVGAIAPRAAAPPEASPVASPTGPERAWQVIETREIAVDGDPVELSPDGRWLAGTADEGNSVCAWGVETLTPTCAELDIAVTLGLGAMAMRWSPDSSAFAFTTGDIARLIKGDVMVFEVETGDVVNLTNTGGADEGPLCIGADWTADSSQVIFAAFNGFGDDANALNLVARDGGPPTEIPLPASNGSLDIVSPPLVAGESVLVAIQADDDAGGVWRVGLDGADPLQLVTASSSQGVPDPLVASVSPDGRHAGIVSARGLQLLEPEGTFFTLDLASGELIPMDFGDGLGLVAFAPEGDTGLIVRDDHLATIDPVTGATQPVVNSPEAETWLRYIPVWAANDTVFLPGEAGGTLVTLAPVS